MKALRTALVITAVVLYATVGWVAGLLVLVVGLAIAVHRTERTRSALAPSIPCPWCRELVPQYGAYDCGVCHAKTLGWAWRCVNCSAWAGHIECPGCGMSVRNPMLGEP